MTTLGPIGRLGRYTATHIRLVAIAWALVAVGLGVLAPKVEKALSGAGWEATGSESVAARKVIDKNLQWPVVQRPDGRRALDLQDRRRPRVPARHRRHRAHAQGRPSRQPGGPAALVRLLLVPVLLRVLGRWAWYRPRWVGRLLPDVHFGHA